MKFKLTADRVIWAIVAFAIWGGVQILIDQGIISAFWLPIIELGAIMAIMSLGLNLIYGFNGQFSLGQFGFYAIGAYASADITWRFADKMKFPMTIGQFNIDPGQTLIFLIAVVVAVGLASLAAYLFGLPVLKLGSDYFGIATLGWTMVIYVLANNSDSIFPEMKGARGMTGIPAMTNWTWTFIALVVTLIVVRNLLYSSAGRAIISVREDETAAKAMGIDVAKYKTISFVVGAAFAGLAGVLYAHLYAFLHPSIFHFVKSFDPMIIVVFGGLGSMTGTLLAAFTWAILLQGAAVAMLPSELLEWRYVIYAVTLVVVMLVRSQGLMGGHEWGFLRRKAPAMRQATTEVQDGNH
jgi:branched-chain amino acid transport system permease protein